MKQRNCWYACDEEGCDATSVPEVDFGPARRTALADGWQFKRVYVQVPMGGKTPFEAHLCPEHHR